MGCSEDSHDRCKSNVKNRATTRAHEVSIDSFSNPGRAKSDCHLGRSQRNTKKVTASTYIIVSGFSAIRDICAVVAVGHIARGYEVTKTGVF
jgi:hypothetical protein